MNISNRGVNLGILGVTAAAMLIAYYYFQVYLQLEPCPLCVSQRIFIGSVGVIALLAALHNPVGVAQKIYNAITALAALAGAAVSGRQLWLQSLPEEQAPACGPTLGFLYDNFPMIDVLNAMFLGEGSCAEVKWQLLGISIPGWTLIAFVLIILTCLWMILRNPVSDAG